ncbi:MAG: hypothetical protein PHX25_01930 [Candidatus Pacebacteria bacterium]|nr:hypothetical protein [Candidatus Paceibacterota bacterium]
MKKIPFYPNLKDNNHCLQACLKMVLKYYFPNKNYSFSKLDKMTMHVKGMWTWQGASLLALAGMGFEVINIENLDYKKFSKRGKNYLKEIWTEEVFETQKRYSDLNQEQKIAGKMIESEKIRLVNRGVNFSDLENYFKKDYLVLVSVNPCVFENKKCYWSHIVLITDINDKWVTFHDVGLPPIENRKISRKKFEKAMTKPWKPDTNLIALKHKK